MELAFLTNAIRRYYWIVLIGAVLGALPGLLVAKGGAARYESRAVLLVAPPSQSLLSVSFAGDPDRYVSGQLSILRSQALAASVADQLSEAGIELAGIDTSVSFDREPKTDVVTIVASAPSPEAAKAIADAHISVYFDQLRAQIEGSQGPEIERLDESITRVRTELADVDDAMLVAIRPFLARDPIPSLEQVAPGLISDKAILLTEYSELQAARARISSGLRVSSEIVQQGTLPTDPVASSRKVLVVVGVFAGGFAGLLTAVVVARLSPTVLGGDQAEEILGHPVVGAFPSVPGLTSNRLSMLGELPPSAALFVESLCVRVEAAAQARRTLSVVVTGTETGAGVTTIAAALARRFVGPGSRVLLVDCDSRDPELSALLMRDPLHALVPPGEGEGPELSALEEALVATSVPNLQVTSLSRLTDLSMATADEPVQTSRRPDMAEVVAIASEHADVVVFDGGALLSSVSTVQLSSSCDAVVLAMPRRPRIRSLEIVANELGGHGHILAVSTPARGLRGSEASSTTTSAPRGRGAGRRSRRSGLRERLPGRRTLTGSGSRLP